MPVTKEGRRLASHVGWQLRKAGGLDICYHDWLSRCRDTAVEMGCPTEEVTGPRPWRMGLSFEGHPVTRGSINFAQFMVVYDYLIPQGGESFGAWFKEWTTWLNSRLSSARVGVVTHNRNIQAVYATVGGVFFPELYDSGGPQFCTVHHYNGSGIQPWDGKELTQGVYLIRHAETTWGT